MGIESETMFGREFSEEAVELMDNMWAGYDEAADESVSIMDFESQIVRAGKWSDKLKLFRKIRNLKLVNSVILVGFLATGYFINKFSTFWISYFVIHSIAMSTFVKLMLLF